MIYLQLVFCINNFLINNVLCLFVNLILDYGTHTCAGYPGSIDDLLKDAQVHVK